MNTTISSSTSTSAITLDQWSEHDWSNGVFLPRLAPHDQIVVRTRNTTYELVVLEPRTASVLVRGGTFFPSFTPARVAGSSLGGGCLKLQGVYTGFQLELVADHVPVITTRVRSVNVLQARDAAVM